jgi:hypothetical protein
MAKKRSRKKASSGKDALLGPPPREATILRNDRQRQAEEELVEHTSTSPALAGGDVDADW